MAKSQPVAQSESKFLLKARLPRLLRAEQEVRSLLEPKFSSKAKFQPKVTEFLAKM